MNCYYRHTGNPGGVGRLDNKTQAECAQYCTSLASSGYNFYYNNDGSTNGALCAAAPTSTCYYRLNGQQAGSLPGLTRDACASYCSYVPAGYSFYYNNDNSTTGNVCASAPAPAPAPVNCQVSGWSDSGACSATACGTQGTKPQSRSVTQQPLYGGAACPNLTQSVGCSAPACPPTAAPAQCYYSYNGFRTGTLGPISRDSCASYCSNYVPAGFSFFYNNDNSTTGNVCPVSSAPAPAPVNCQVSGWSDSGACSATACGTQGIKTQSRSVTQQPMYGGAACPNLTQPVSCSAPACPPPTAAPAQCYYRYNGGSPTQIPGLSKDQCAAYCPTYVPYGYSFFYNNDGSTTGSLCAAPAPAPAPAPVNCQVSGWSDSGACSATACGTQGTRQQSRTVTQQPSNGGAACPNLTQSVSCSAPACAPVDCQVSGWSDSGACSATACGTQGTRQQSRTVTQQPLHGGAACPNLTQSVSCSAPACAAPPTTAPSGGANEWDQLLWGPGTPVCWTRRKDDNTLLEIHKTTEESCKQSAVINTNSNYYFNTTGDKTNPMLPPRTAKPNSKCITGNWAYDKEVKVDNTKTTEAQCATLCSTNSPYVYWEPDENGVLTDSICNLDDKEQCWSQFSANYVRMTPYTSNLLNHQIQRCTDTCGHRPDGSLTPSDKAMDIQFQRGLGARFWSKRGPISVNGTTREQERCMDKNVKRCWYKYAGNEFRSASDGTLADQIKCATNICGTPTNTDVKWGVTRATGIDLCSHPNRLTTLL